ncbi:MAG: tetratricopeptide repeat protein [Halieaceae bacterium]|nr:tetratricopeptide repeat protein [Halieaceae bacterium]
MRYLLFYAALLTLLTACAGAPSRQPAETEPMVPANSTEVQQEVQQEAVLRPFPDDSLYPLLVAEIALRRRDYDTALRHYMELAPRLRDREISAQAARLAQYLRKDEEAMAATALWVQLEPDNRGARLALANLQARRGMRTEALAQMAVVARAGGAPNFSALARGFEQLGRADQDQLLAGVDALREEFPGNTQLLVCKSLMLAALGRRQQALQELQPVFDSEPGQMQALVLDASLRQELDLNQGIYERIKAALREQPERDQLRLQYARLLTRTDLSEARRQFQLLSDKSPENTDLLLSLALIQRDLGELDAARGKLERMLELDPGRSEADYLLGQIAEQQQRYQDALKHFMRIPPGPNFTNANRRLGRMLLGAGQRELHSEHFDKLRKQYPHLLAQLFVLEVESLHNQRLYGISTEVLDRALGALPEQTDLQYLRSIAWEKQGNLTRMEADLRAILLREPDNATALNALGYTLANRTRRFQEAQQLIERALQLEPDEPAILDSFGWVRYRLGDREQALEYLRRAYHMFPDPEVAAHLGEVLWSLGKADEAMTIWKTALGESPGHEIVLETMQRLGAGDQGS